MKNKKLVIAGGASDTSEFMQELKNLASTDELLRKHSAIALAVLEDINPRDSWRASKAFRQHIAVEMAKRCLIESIKLAGGDVR